MTRNGIVVSAMGQLRSQGFFEPLLDGSFDPTVETAVYGIPDAVYCIGDESGKVSMYVDDQWVTESANQ